MAQRFYQEAEQQVAPIYDEQIRQQEAQIPSIEKLYDSLGTSLRGEYETNLNRGVQNILEDASARGVLRSTLPVDTRTQLTGDLQSALTKGLADIGRQRLSDISGIQNRVGELRTSRLSAITSLADALQQAYDREQAAAAQRASAAAQNAWTNALLNAGGAGAGAAGPSYTRKDGGGFAFTDAQGNPISAAGYAQATGKDIRDVLYEIGQKGDTYAQQVYNQILQDPFFEKNIGAYVNTYSPLFWGTTGPTISTKYKAPSGSLPVSNNISNPLISAVRR